MRFIEACRRFISIDSTQAHGTGGLMNFAATLCQEAGLEVQLQEEKLNGQVEKNLVARFQQTEPSSQKELLLQTHLDTPDPGIFSLWTKTGSNPFNAHIYGDTLVGLGASSGKLDFLCKLEACKKFSGKKLKRPLALVGTYGMESGMVGAIKLIRKKLVNANTALIGQPTDLNLVSAGSGLAVVEVSIPFSKEEILYNKNHDIMLSSSCQSKIFYGKSAHSSFPKLGENAIVSMLEYLAQLPNGLAILDIEGGVSYNTIPDSAVLEIDLHSGFSEPTVSEKIHEILKAVKSVELDFANYPAKNFDPPIPTLNIGQIKKYKDHIRALGCCRVNPNVPQSVYENWMNQLGEACENQQAHFRVVEYKQAFETQRDSEFIQGTLELAKNLNLNAQLNSISVCTEANVFSRLGVECLVFGAGVSPGNVCAPNESVSIEKLKQSIVFYEECIEKFCL